MDFEKYDLSTVGGTESRLSKRKRIRSFKERKKLKIDISLNAEN